MRGSGLAGGDARAGDARTVNFDENSGEKPANFHENMYCIFPGIGLS